MRVRFQLRSLLRHAVPYWICVCIFFFAAFVVVLMTLRQQEQDRARQLLQHYQAIYQQSGPSGLQLSYTAARDHTGNFLRLEGSNLRLILVTNDGRSETQTMPDFSSFPKSINLVWHALQPGRSRGPWTVAATSLADGNTLQIGINSVESLHLLQRMGRVLLQLSFMLLVLCFIPAWFAMRKSSKTIRSLTEQINSMSNEITRKLQGNQETGPEGGNLIKAVNSLLSRHQRLTRELQESMDNVAHDLRTPITRLRSIAEYGLHKGEDNAHLREALADCLEESDRLLSMLNTMLNVAEAEADTVKLDLQPVPLEDSISGVLDLYSIIAEEQGVVIHFTPQPDLVILADRQRISQVWANLLDNAIKYNSTEITISTSRQNDMALIMARDNGMGISENEINYIWDRLFRGDRSRSKPGLGLGLTLVRATVNSHNGTIDVSSTLNQGTTFTIKLPLARTE
ncbi:MAG: HAMP domain-containing sensor histidine kinase [Thermodesulfobacteriota bacterium]|nr:HAMP domain-containing sensor histidine kinase [Thermodesulfobacteriota bacterium]